MTIDFQFTAGRICTQYEQVVIVLDPTDRSVTTYVTNQGDPARPAKWDARGCVILDCPSEVDEGQVEALLRERESEIAELMASKDDGRICELVDGLEAALEDLPRYWEAGDWIGDTASDLEAELKKAFDEGAEKGAAIKAIATRLASEAKADDALVAVSDLEDWLGERWDEIAADDAEAS